MPPNSSIMSVKPAKFVVIENLIGTPTKLLIVCVNWPRPPWASTELTLPPPPTAVSRGMSMIDAAFACGFTPMTWMASPRPTPFGSRESLPTTRKNCTPSGWPLVKLAPATGGTFWTVNQVSPFASGNPIPTHAAITMHASSTPHSGGPTSVSRTVRRRSVISSPSPWSSPRPGRPVS